MYTINYDLNGKPDSISTDNLCIPIDPRNSDFQQFLLWNAQQLIPLDYQKSIVSNIIDFDKSQLKADFANTITTLTNIENAVSPTNVQVITAVKFLAKTTRLILKLLAKIYF